METSRLESEIYSALKNNSELMELLPTGESSIFHLQAPSVYPDLPFLVYSPISDVPVLHADNKEFLHRVTIRIHIVHGEKDYSQIYFLIKNIMQALGFTRVQATLFLDSNGKQNFIADFKIITTSY